MKIPHRRRSMRKLTVLFWHLPNRRLWARIFPVIFMTVAVPLTFLGLLWLHTSEQAMRKTVMAEHEQFVVIASSEISLFMQRARDILDSASAMLGVVYPSPWRQETVLVELVLEQPLILRALSVDVQGNPWAVSELGRPLPGPYSSEILSAASREGVYVSDVRMKNEGTPYVTVVVPIKKIGRTIGYLIGDVDLREAWDVVDHMRLGETGYAFLVSRDGRLIAHPDKKRAVRKEDVSAKPDVRRALAGSTGSDEIKNSSGKAVIAGYTSVPGTGWGLVLRQDRDEAFRFSKIMKVEFLFIILAGWLLALLASVFIAHFLTRPIQLLGARIRAVAAGDLDQRWAVSRRDEIGELARSFNRMTVKLREAREKTRLSVIGEAASWISHELKNSLMLLKLFVHSFSTERTQPDFIDKFDKLLPSEIARWERLLNEFSGLSSSDTLKTSRFGLHRLLEETLQVMAQRLAANGIDVLRRWPPQEIFLTADQERLKQVFVNLILNAIEAMPQGGSLTIASAYDGNAAAAGAGDVEVRVEDTGWGIPSERLDKIFDPLYTTQKGHSGLGLSISRKIVEQHGGDIRVESTVGRGTTFIIRLPLVAPVSVSP
ncbi:MAG: ATP-binding protein [Deltaproteobacteria bacterium]